MNIEISGAVLSSLFFEHSVCNNDLEGFLLGRITNRRTDTISDAQISGVKEETTCYIYSYVSCPRPFSWYANSGATDADKLKNVLSANKITVSDVCMSFDRCFQGLPVSVINLGDNVIQYKIQGTLSVTCNGGRFAEIINRQW
ncbi:hypothetical protein LSH36_356g03023 [Paralvinella palmiformis]|uniref:Uncharacterized protein n=1 Tax=Paralvinella palmiformis TaxID=53620 RepID=A0AAD9JFE5_9ANNE|nr:hypothetical protein LSH36_356g03023 [Paralvinella palmiformis]